MRTHCVETATEEKLVRLPHSQPKGLYTKLLFRVLVMDHAKNLVLLLANVLAGTAHCRAASFLKVFQREHTTFKTEKRQLVAPISKAYHIHKSLHLMSSSWHWSRTTQASHIHKSVPHLINSSGHSGTTTIANRPRHLRTTCNVQQESARHTA